MSTSALVTSFNCHLICYNITEILGSILDLPIDHLTPQNTVDKTASGKKQIDEHINEIINHRCPYEIVSRPENSHLSVKRLQESGIDTTYVKLANWFSQHLTPKAD